MIKSTTLLEIEKGQRAARLETWAEYLCLPIRCVRERLCDVIMKASGVDQEGKRHQNAYYLEEDIAKYIPEYKIVRELEEIGKTKEEIRRAILTRVLADSGFPDQRSIEQESPNAFSERSLAPYGKGVAFCAEVLKKPVRGDLKRSHLLNMSRTLQLPMLTEERKLILKNILLRHGYGDRRSLARVNIDVFRQTDFHPFGKGYSFFSEITGRTGSLLSKKNILEIADTLELPELSEERKKELSLVLKIAGFPDARSIKSIGQSVFTEKEFSTYGKGRAFLAEVTGKKYQTISSKDLEEMIKILDLPLLTEEGKHEIRSILANAGFTDRRSLEIVSVYLFQRIDFKPYGKFFALYTQITGEKCRNLHRKQLMEVADLLSLPELSQKRKGEIQNALQTEGYPDSQSIKEGAVNVFEKKSFSYLGNARDIYRLITGKAVPGNLQKIHMHEIADFLRSPIISNIQSPVHE